MAITSTICLIYGTYLLTGLFRLFLGCLHGISTVKQLPLPFTFQQRTYTTKHCHDTLHDGQSQSETVFLWRHLTDVQRTEYPSLFLFGHARTRIFDDKFQQTVIITCYQDTLLPVNLMAF